VLLHPTSLPGPHGCGDLGHDAHQFVDFMREAGFTLWQVMPLGPPGYGDSPYAARSVFAGNNLLISLDSLIDEGLLRRDEVHPPAFPVGKVDFEAVAAWKRPLLRKAFDRFKASGAARELDDFSRRNAFWLHDYALYMALAEREQTWWIEWPPELVRRRPEALERAAENLADEVQFRVFLQARFWRQWGALRARANAYGIRIIGDIPIFPAHDSADVWSHQDIFKLGRDGGPTVVAGVPPDFFSATGQLWGNPVYRWDVLQDHGYLWWIERFRHLYELVDIIRLDHFRGFQAAWEVPAGDETAEHGTWAPGPGRDFFNEVRARLGSLEIIVEDLGTITRDVRELRDSLGFPGMKVLQFAFGDDARNPYLPHNYAPDSVVYTGTHDNDTTLGWFLSLEAKERERVLRYVARDGRDIVSDLARLAYESVASTAIIPMQDVLQNGSEGRMNTPGRADGNWAWRFQWDQLHPGRVAWLRELALVTARLKPDDTP
jgi:4-alpha-glucanotransferase